MIPEYAEYGYTEDKEKYCLIFYWYGEKKEFHRVYIFLFLCMIESFCVFASLQVIIIL